MVWWIWYSYQNGGGGGGRGYRWENKEKGHPQWKCGIWSYFGSKGDKYLFKYSQMVKTVGFFFKNL